MRTVDDSTHGVKPQLRAGEAYAHEMARAGKPLPRAEAPPAALSAYFSAVGETVEDATAQLFRPPPLSELPLVAGIREVVRDAIAEQRPARRATPEAVRADGYVELPYDATAYVPVARILAKHALPDINLTTKEFATLLDDYASTRVRWMRPVGRDGKPRSNRRSVHLTDWTAFVERRRGTTADGWPRVSPAEVAERVAAIRRRKGIAE